MKKFNCVITDPVGIHARPAGQMVKVAKYYSESVITVIKGDKKVSASNLMKLMGMGIKCGDTITVSVDGGDEDAALNAMQAFLQENLGDIK